MASRGRAESILNEREELAVRYRDIGLSPEDGLDALHILYCDSSEGSGILTTVANHLREAAVAAQGGGVETLLDAAREEEERAGRDVREQEGKLERVKRAIPVADSWIEPLERSVTPAIKRFIEPHKTEINRLFKRLTPHSRQFDEIFVDTLSGGGLQLGLRYRDHKSAAGLPEFFLSTAQTNVLALSMFLAFARSQRWSTLQTMLLDDPVQHLDDLDSIAFLDCLKTVIQSDDGRQVIMSTCDRNLYAHMIRKFSLVEAPSRLRFTAISLEDHVSSGVRVDYDWGGPPQLTTASA